MTTFLIVTVLIIAVTAMIRNLKRFPKISLFGNNGNHLTMGIIAGLLAMIAVLATGITFLMPRLSTIPYRDEIVGVALIVTGIGLGVLLLRLLFGKSNPQQATTASSTTAETKVTSDWTWTSYMWLTLVLTIKVLVGVLVLTGKWKPTIGDLLLILLVGLVFYRLAPKTESKPAKFMIALTVAGFVLLLANAIIPTGMYAWVKEAAVKTDACFRDPNCVNYSGPTVYPPGKIIYLGSHLPKESPKIFRFSGRVTLYNGRPCSAPIIEYMYKKEYKVILPEQKHLTILQAEPGKTPEVAVWLQQETCS